MQPKDKRNTKIVCFLLAVLIVSGKTDFNICVTGMGQKLDKKRLLSTGQTNGRTPDRYIDPAPHTMPAASTM